MNFSKFLSGAFLVGLSLVGASSFAMEEDMASSQTAVVAPRVFKQLINELNDDISLTFSKTEEEHKEDQKVVKIAAQSSKRIGFEEDETLHLISMESTDRRTYSLYHGYMREAEDEMAGVIVPSFISKLIKTFFVEPKEIYVAEDPYNWLHQKKGFVLSDAFHDDYDSGITLSAKHMAVSYYIFQPEDSSGEKQGIRFTNSAFLENGVFYSLVEKDVDGRDAPWTLWESNNL